jgi:hypothetical protein
MTQRWPFDQPPGAPIDFVAISLGSEDLLGTPATWNGVEVRLRSYSLAEVLDLLGRISILLSQADSDPKVQGQILSGLFGPKSVVHKRLDTFTRSFYQRKGQHLLVLFHEAQIANAVKAAFLAIPPNYSPPPAPRPDHRKLGQALLIINSLIAEGAVPFSHDKTQAGEQNMELFFAANSGFNAGGAGLHEFARAAELYLRDRPHLSNRPSYRNLADDIQSLTGLSPTELWGIFFAIFAHLANIKREDMPFRGARLIPATLFNHLPKFAPEQVSAFLQLVAQDETELRNAIQERYSWNSIKPFDFVPLARRPLVRVGEEYYLLGLRFLEEKLTTGLHHLFLDTKNGLASYKDRQGYLTYMGYVWEDYVHESLKRGYHDNQEAIMISEDVIKQQVSKKSIDAIIVVDGIALLIEAKATMFALATRAGEDWEGYLSKLKELVFDAAEQIDCTIQAIESGAFRNVGVEPSKIRRYLPVVVSLEPALMNPLLASRLEAELKDNGWLQQQKTGPIQLLDPSELELIEAGASAGQAMHAVLDEKSSHPNLAGVTFRNYLVSTDDPVLDQRSSYLTERFEQLTREGIAFLRDSGGGTDDSETDSSSRGLSSE